MMGELGRWAVETRSGQVLARLATVLLILGAAYAVIWEEVHRQTDPIVKRIETIERVKPVDVVRECLRTQRCRRLLIDPVAYVPSGGDASKPAPAGKRPQPGRPGGTKRPGTDRGTDRPSRPNRPSVPDQTSPPSPGATSQLLPPIHTPAPAPEPPGLASPALERVCEVADRLAHLC